MKTLILVILCLYSNSLQAEDDDEFVDPDPWVKLNTVTHNFNDFVDQRLVRPVAVGYARVIPRIARTGIANVFANLEDVGDAINNLLQGKGRDGVNDVGRVLVNSVIGLGGLFDPATPMGLIDHEEDFGQTFARWGVPAGPYFVIPGLGPSSVRDGLARLLDGSVNPLRYLYPVAHRNTLYGLDGLQTRADLLSVDGLVFGNKYIFYRNAYTQRREYLINDGEASDPFADDF